MRGRGQSKGSHDDGVVRPISEAPLARNSAVSRGQPSTLGLPSGGTRERNTGADRKAKQHCPVQSHSWKTWLPVCPALHSLPGSLQYSSGGDCVILAACLRVLLLPRPAAATSVPLLRTFLQLSPRKPLLVPMCVLVSVIPYESSESLRAGLYSSLASLASCGLTCAPARGLTLALCLLQLSTVLLQC